MCQSNRYVHCSLHLYTLTFCLLLCYYANYMLYFLLCYFCYAILFAMLCYTLYHEVIVGYTIVCGFVFHKLYYDLWLLLSYFLLHEWFNKLLVCHRYLFHLDDYVTRMLFWRLHLQVFPPSYPLVRVLGAHVILLIIIL